MNDKETGISIRFIREYDAAADRMPLMFDRALMLAGSDPRTDVPFVVKLADAQAFLRRQVH